VHVVIACYHDCVQMLLRCLCRLCLRPCSEVLSSSGTNKKVSVPHDTVVACCLHVVSVTMNVALNVLIVQKELLNWKRSFKMVVHMAGILARMCICVSVCLSVFLSVCVYLSLCVYVSVYQFCTVHWSVCISLCVCLCVCLPVCLCVYWESGCGYCDQGWKKPRFFKKIFLGF